MNKNDYDRLTNLAALTELPGERDYFLESLIPFYVMMDKVRNAVLEEGEAISPEDAFTSDEPVLELRKDELHACAVSERLPEASERRDGAYFTVPRSI